jgi:hypothetical protein
MPPQSLLNGHTARPCSNGVQLRGSRLHPALKTAHAGRHDASGGATTATPNGEAASNGTSNPHGGSVLHPMCQPMPVQMLVQLMESLSTHRPPAQDSRAILTALNDYIGDVIAQPGPGLVSENCHFNSAADSSSASPSPKPPVQPRMNGMANGLHPFNMNVGKPADGDAADAPKGRGFVVRDMKRGAVAGATVTATAQHNAGSAHQSSVASTPATTLQEHVLRWSADLGILQALHANGYSETEVENFVHKLLPGLADGVTSQLSQAGFPVSALSAVPAPTTQDVAAASAAVQSPAISAADALPPLQPAAKNRVRTGCFPKPVQATAIASTSSAEGSTALAAGDAGSAVAGNSSSKQLATVSQPGAMLTDKVSPFIQHPYHLLQQLHAQQH